MEELNAIDLEKTDGNKKIPSAADFVVSGNVGSFTERLMANAVTALGEYASSTFIVYDMIEDKVIDGGEDRGGLVQGLFDKHGEDFGARYMVIRNASLAQDARTKAEEPAVKRLEQ